MQKLMVEEPQVRGEWLLEIAPSYYDVRQGFGCFSGSTTFEQSYFF